MFNTLKAARTIAKNLGASEKSIDETLIDQTQLLLSILRGGLDTETNAQDSGPAIEHAISAVYSLGQARASTVACHRELAGVRDRMGIKAELSGCVLTKLFNADQSEPARSAHAA